MRARQSARSSAEKVLGVKGEGKRDKGEFSLLPSPFSLLPSPFSLLPSPLTPTSFQREEDGPMRALMTTAGTLIFAIGFVAGGQLERPVGAQGLTVVMDCGVASAPQLRTTLYFGLARPKGTVTELEWQL